jgi:hypothetical protein
MTSCITAGYCRPLLRQLWWRVSLLHHQDREVDHDGWGPSSQFAKSAPTGLDCVEETNYGGLVKLASALHRRGEARKLGDGCRIALLEAPVTYRPRLAGLRLNGIVGCDACFCSCCYVRSRIPAVQRGSALRLSAAYRLSVAVCKGSEETEAGSQQPPPHAWKLVSLPTLWLWRAWHQPRVLFSSLE